MIDTILLLYIIPTRSCLHLSFVLFDAGVVALFLLVSFTIHAIELSCIIPSSRCLHLTYMLHGPGGVTYSF